MKWDGVAGGRLEWAAGGLGWGGLDDAGPGSEVTVYSRGSMQIVTPTGEWVGMWIPCLLPEATKSSWDACDAGGPQLTIASSMMAEKRPKVNAMFWSLGSTI